jgi:hypothetical protein
MNTPRLTHVAATVTAVAILLLAASGPGLTADVPVAKPSPYPKLVLLVRHAEKPLPDEPFSAHLTPLGQERARALPALFKASGARPRPFPTPDFLFAAQDTDKSHRPVETIAPLAKFLKLPVNQEYQTAETKKLADAILGNPKYAGKIVLVSWRHSKIPELARAFGATNAPAKWQGSVYDRVWQISYDAAGKATFVDRPQRLMPKDSDK